MEQHITDTRQANRRFGKHAPDQHDLSVLFLSRVGARRRKALLAEYREAVYDKAFPDSDLAENPEDWAQYIDGKLPPPLPHTEVILLLREGKVIGGATVEYYRQADAGLLTYLAIAEDYREKGLSRRLVDAAHKALAAIASKSTLLFAETEKFDDTAEEDERAALIRRHRRLDALGAYAIDFDYVMPPLRPGAEPRALHLLVLDPPDPGRAPRVSAHTVRALLQELAQSLQTRLEDHAPTRAMEAFLAGRKTLTVSRLPGTRFDRRFRETPVIPLHGPAAFTFAFELGFTGQRGEEQPPAIVLKSIMDTLLRDKKVREKLIEPARSYLDDVTTGPPGHNGRPLLFLAAGDYRGSPSRRVMLKRPERWLYKAENEGREMHAAPRTTAFELRDCFCVFESGRVFYLPTLVLPEDAEEGIDEYTVLQLQALAMKPEDPDEVRRYGDLEFTWQPFEHDGPLGGSIFDFIEARLAWLERNEPATQPGAFRDLIHAYGIRRPGFERRAVRPADLRNLCISIESEELVQTAERANAIFDHDGNGAPDLSRLKSADRSWIAPGGTLDLPPHDDPENDIDRKLLALAGLATGVPDFPWQDKSEVHDSTRPGGASVDSVLYVHPRFILEVAREWRSFTNSLESLGNCPYLLLMWIAAVQDELTVTTIEDRIEDMIYDPGREPARFRAIAMRDVDSVRRNAKRMSGRSGARILEKNLQRRLDLFRFHTIHRTGKIFRYPKEKAALEMLLHEKGIDDRFERALAMIDRIEGLVEDTTSMKSAYTEKRTNQALAVIALLGLVSVGNDIALALEKSDSVGIVTFWVLITAALVLIAYFIWNEITARRDR